MKKSKSPSLKRSLKPTKRFRLRYILYALVLFLVFIAGRQYWNYSPQTNAPAVPLQTVNPPQEQNLKNKEEVSETDVNDDEETTDSEDNPKSPWTLLETGLSPQYDKPSFKTETPSLAIILTGLGINEALTEKALALPPQITLAFSPYSPKVSEKLQQARSLGHQILISLPLEPHSYPNTDPGPYTLLTGLNPAENVNKTTSILKMAPKGTGVIGEYGSRFLISKDDLEPVFKEIQSQGAFFIDPNTTVHSQSQNICKSLNIGFQQVDFTLPRETNVETREDFFKNVVQNAKENGILIISIPGTPAFINYLHKWLDDIKTNGINLVSINDLETSKLSPDHSGKQQGTTNDIGQNSHEPR